MAVLSFTTSPVTMHRTSPLVLILLALAGCAEQAPKALTNPAWAVQASGTTARLQAVSIVDANVVWASGTGGTVAVTTDGGDTWRSGIVPGADSLEFRDVHGVDAQTAFLLSAGPGDASRIYRTTDGGASWTLQFTNPEPAGFFDCFDFWDADHGLAFSDTVDGQLYLLTTDDGEHWRHIPPETLPQPLPNEGAFAASGTCVVTGEAGQVWFGTGASGVAARVFSSADFGRTWTVVETPLFARTPSSGIYTLAFRDQFHGAVLGGDYAHNTTLLDSTVAITTDGGRTWSRGGNAPLRGAVFGAAYIPGATTLLAVGPDGSARSDDDGRTWTRLDTLNYWSVDALAPDAVWAVGPDGRIAKLTSSP